MMALLLPQQPQQLGQHPELIQQRRHLQNASLSTTYTQHFQMLCPSKYSCVGLLLNPMHAALNACLHCSRETTHCQVVCGAKVTTQHQLHLSLNGLASENPNTDFMHAYPMQSNTVAGYFETPSSWYFA